MMHLSTKYAVFVFMLFSLPAGSKPNGQQTSPNAKDMVSYDQKLLNRS